MKKIYFVFFIMYMSSAFAQSSVLEFTQDLEFIYHNLKQSSSFQTQKNKHHLIEKHYQELKNMNFQQPISALRAYLYLYELIDHISDYHNEVIAKENLSNYSRSYSKENRDNLLPLAEFSNLDLDSVQLVLKQTALDSYPGIYNYKDHIQVAVVQESALIYQGIVLQSNLDNWQEAEIIFYLVDKGNNRFRLVGRDLKTRDMLSGLDYYKDGKFKGSGWTKVDLGNKVDYSIVTSSSKMYDLIQIDSLTSYLKLGSFAINPNTLKKSKEFYNRLKNSEIRENLVVDLRNNPGGSEKNSKRYLRLLKEYAGEVIVLVNFNTVSRAEQFALELKKQNKAIIAGDFTKGMLSYGRNYGSYIFTPSLNYKLSFTDLKDNYKTFLPYEGKGIKPDVFLHDHRDWVDQVLD